MTQTICSLTVGLKWVVVDKWTRYGAIVSFDIITYTGLFWFQMVQVIYRRFWHILRIFFQYLYESRYFDHSCILCVVPYASEKFGQIWTKMIEEAMMRLFLRKKTITGRNFDRFKKSELILDTILLGRNISFSFPCDMNIIQLPHCSGKRNLKMISNFGTISKLLFTFKTEKNDDMVGTFDQKRPWSRPRSCASEFIFSLQFTSR